MRWLERLIPKRKTEAGQPDFESFRYLEPERKTLQGVLCILTYVDQNETKFVMVSLPSEDTEPITKAEAIKRKTELLFLAPNMLSFPGGAMEGQEEAEEALTREIFEELNLSIDRARLQQSGIEAFTVMQSTEGSGRTIMFANGRLHSYDTVVHHIRIPRDQVDTFDRKTLGFRYGTYWFAVNSFIYQLNEEEVSALKDKMTVESRRVCILTKDEVMSLKEWELKPSTRELIELYLEQHS